MANTFDIRFARSGGLAAFFEAPANSFRWKGVGRLSIDANGISIAARRGLLTLFPRTRRVAADDLKQVLREGDALRVEFKTPQADHVVMPFWVRDANTAEQIVRLLPTTRTVELDHDAAGVGRAGFHPDWRALAIIAGLLVLATLATMSLREGDAPPATASQATVDVHAPAVAPAAAAPAQEAALPANAAQPAIAASEPAPLNAAAAPGTRDMRISPAAAQFEAPNPYDAASVVESPAEPAPAGVVETPSPRVVRAETQPGNWSVRVNVIDGVVPIVAGMPSYSAARRQLDIFLSEAAAGGDLWNATVRIYHEPDFDDPELWPLRDMELAVASSRRDARQSRNEAVQEFADRLESRVNLYVR